MICTTCNVAHERTYVGAIDVECWGNNRCPHWAGLPPGPEPEHCLMHEARRAARRQEWPDGTVKWHQGQAAPERVADIHVRLVEAYELSSKRWTRHPDAPNVHVPPTPEVPVQLTDERVGTMTGPAKHVIVSSDLPPNTEYALSTELMDRLRADGPVTAPETDEAFVRRVDVVQHVRGHVYLVGCRILERPDWSALASELRERGLT